MVPYLLRVLWRTQRMMKPEAYLGEYQATNRTCPGSSGSAGVAS
jgi:hypothetical protein